MAKDDCQKKQKPAKDASPATGSKRAIKEETEGEEDSQPNKKQKDPQKVNPKGSLNVPVDEVFNHPTIFRSGGKTRLSPPWNTFARNILLIYLQHPRYSLKMMA